MTTVTPGAVELKPCPFCNSPAELERGNDHHGDWFNLGCSRHWGHQRNPDHTNTCIAGRMFYTEIDVPEAEAIAAWNSRATPPDALQTVVEAWLPIESAPRDGTRFLAWCPYVGRAIMRIHGLHRETWAIDPSGKLGCQPTHWMPLPKPPALSLAGGDV